MNSEKQPAPGPTFKRSDGKWTFYVFPDGQQQEAGHYDSEAAAKDARFKVLLQWGSNGKKYAPIGL
jgi:hypothetical protein